MTCSCSGCNPDVNVAPAKRTSYPCDGCDQCMCLIPLNTPVGDKILGEDMASRNAGAGGMQFAL
jgi:hypothetical protein